MSRHVALYTQRETFLLVRDVLNCEKIIFLALAVRCPSNHAHSGQQRAQSGARTWGPQNRAPPDTAAGRRGPACASIPVF